MLFPSDAITVSFSATGGGTTCGTLLASTSTPRTLLYGRISYFGDNAGSSSIKIASTPYLSGFAPAGNTYGQLDIFAPVVFENADIVCQRTAGSSALYSVVYIPRDISAQRNDIYTTNGFSFGEVVISTFVFLIFVVVAYTALFNWIVGIKIKK